MKNSELIDWVEGAALENLRFHLQLADALAKESATTLTILLAGAGASLAYAVRTTAPVMSPTAWAMLMLTCYLFTLCGLLVWKCMKVAPIPAPTNEPQNLYQKEYVLDDLREVELNNIQERINQAVARNDAVTAWLNRLRLAAVVSPAVFLASLYLAQSPAGQVVAAG